MTTSRNKSASLQHNVTVDNEEFTVWIAKSGATWRAHGWFRTRLIETRGQSESSALRNWIELANSEANV